MPARSKVSTLPPELRTWLDAALMKGNFAGYAELAEELRARGVELGVAADVSKSGLHRYGSKLEQRLSAIKASTEAAKLINAAAPDDADLRSAAVISLIQTELFEAIVSLQEADTAEDAGARVELLSKAAKNIATLARASVGQKRHELDVRAKVQLVADEVEATARGTGAVSEEVIQQFRNKILGIAS